LVTEEFRSKFETIELPVNSLRKCADMSTLHKTESLSVISGNDNSRIFYESQCASDRCD